MVIGTQSMLRVSCSHLGGLGGPRPLGRSVYKGEGVARRGRLPGMGVGTCSAPAELEDLSQEWIQTPALGYTGT